MMKSLSTIALLLTLSVAAAPGQADAQSEVLAEMYGRGVHAYYAGDYSTAYDLLSMAIDNGSQDPRAYYFRGLVSHASGRPEEAESDWQQGAELEAQGRVNAEIGRSLSRFQGAARLKLESIRQKARLEALAEAAKRSEARYGEIEAAESRVLRQPPQPATPPATAAPQAAPPVTPPVAADDDPFADDMAAGQPAVQADDALEGAMENPFAGEAVVPAGEVPPNDTNNPFGGGGGDASDPFGGGGGDASDPFGGAGGDSSDPFGGDAGGGSDPFGGADDAGSDPFGGAMDDDPFGN